VIGLGRYAAFMGRKRTPPSGLPKDRLGGSLLSGLETHIDGPVGFRPEGVRRVRNVFVALALGIGALVLVVLAAGNPDSAIGMTMALLAPVTVFAVISQLILWSVDEPT
jgi:hypothetical protein